MVCNSRSMSLVLEAGSSVCLAAYNNIAHTFHSYSRYSQQALVTHPSLYAVLILSAGPAELKSKSYGTSDQ